LISESPAEETFEDLVASSGTDQVENII
jgi:hypothetical protein